MHLWEAVAVVAGCTMRHEATYGPSPVDKVAMELRAIEERDLLWALSLHPEWPRWDLWDWERNWR